MPRAWSRPLGATTLVVLLPFVVLAVSALGVHAPSGDVALLEVRVGDVGGRWTPLVGSYQRFGFNQPGPLLLEILAAPYRVFASSYGGLQLGALLIGAVSVSCMLRFGWRRGGRTGLLWTALLVAVLVHGLGPAWLVDPWEPHVLALVAAALFALTCDVGLGRVAALPWVVVAASLIAQAWATMLLFAVVLATWATLAVVVHAGRSTAARRDAFRALVVAAVVGFVLWIPPLLDQLTQSPSNVSAALDALADANEPAVGLADAARAVATELGPDASWLGFPQRLEGLSPTLDLDLSPMSALGIVALAAATAIGARSGPLRGPNRAQHGGGDGEPRSTAGAWVVGATALVAIGGAVLAMSRLLGPLFVWLPQWLRVVGMTTWLAAGWCAAAALRPSERVRTVLDATFAALTAIVVVLSMVDAVTYEPAPDPLGASVRRLVSDARDQLDDEPLLVASTADAPVALGGQDVAVEVLVRAVEGQGHETRVEESLANKFGKGRAHPTDAAAELRLVRADEAVPDGFRVVAERDPLSATQRARRTDLLTRLGLPPDATDADALRIAATDPSTRATVRQLRRLPDLPPLRLLLDEQLAHNG